MKLRYRFIALAVVISAVGLVALPRESATAACAALPSDKGQVSYTLNVTTAATYRVWARLYPASANNNGIYLQIDNTTCNVVMGHNNAIPAGQFTWVDYGNTSTSKVNVALTAGNHAVTLAGYDPSVGVDRLLFLADMNCVPSGDGSNCTTTASVSPTPSATPAPGGAGGSTGGSGSSPAPSATPVAVGSSSSPVAVSGTIKLTPSSSLPAGSKVTYKVDGKTVTGSNLDTSKLPDGLHTITEVVTTPDGKSTTKTQTIKVENGWQYQVVRAIQQHPSAAAGVLAGLVLIGVGGFYLFGPKKYAFVWWAKLFGGGAAVAATPGPAAPSAYTPASPAPGTVYPDKHDS